MYHLSVLLLCLVPPHLRLTPRKDHARELVNLVKESSGKQEAAASGPTRLVCSQGLWHDLQEKKNIIMIKGEDGHQNRKNINARVLDALWYSSQWCLFAARSFRANSHIYIL